MVQMVLGAIAGYVLFAVLGAIALYGMLAFVGPGSAFNAGFLYVSGLWLVISLFVTGWVAGLAGKVAAKVGERPEAAVILGLAIAIQGFFMMPADYDTGTLTMAQLETLSSLDLLEYLRFPEWYALTLPLFAAAFAGYGGYISTR
jgi:hypothetical protein